MEKDKLKPELDGLEFDNDFKDLGNALDLEGSAASGQLMDEESIKELFEQEQEATGFPSNKKQAPKAPKESTAGRADKPSKMSAEDDARSIKTLHELPVLLSVELGRSEVLVSDLMLMGQGSIIELDRLISDDLDVLVNGRPIAQGTIVLSNNNFGCKISHILTPIERLHKLVMKI